MPFIARLRSLGRNLVRRDAIDNELTAELRAYIDLLTAENIEKRGMSPDEARRAALLAAGGEEQLKEQVRDARTGAWVETLLRDLRYGARMLVRAPGFTVTAIVTLALGIGANTALFTVVNGVLLRPLPYPHSEQLYALHASKPPNFPTGSISYPNFLDWQRRNRTFSAMALNRGTGFNLISGGEPERIRGQWITADFFPLLGVQPLLGRHMAPGEDAVGGAFVVEISEGLWKRRFGASPNILGRAITLDDRSFTVIGVIPASFDLLQSNLSTPDVYVPLGQLRTPALQRRGAGLGLHGFGRLKPGVSLAQAREDMARVTGELASEFPDINRGVGAALVPLKDAIVGDVRPILLFLLAAVAFVLLIACVNVASLLLARSASRAREFAVRAALGASRSRLVRQLLTESVLLGLAGGVVGLAIASWGTRAALALLPQALPRMQEVRLDARVLLFTVGISTFAGLLFALAPAFRITSPELRSALNVGRSAGGRRLRPHRVLIVVEVATALLLLVGTGLMLRSLARLWQSDPGFNPHNVTTFYVDLPSGMRGASPTRLRAAWRQIHDSVADTPGILAASLRDGSMIMQGDDEIVFWHAGEPEPPSGSEKSMALRYDVMPEYLQTFGISLHRGRFFSPQESDNTPTTIVVDDVFAATYFPGEDALGKRILWSVSTQPQNGAPEKKRIVEAEIVGIVGHVKQWGLEADDTQPLRAQLYTNLLQAREEDWEGAYNLGLSARFDGDSVSATRAVRDALRRLNAELVVYGFHTMDEMIEQSLRDRRFSMVLLATFALAALLLAAVGIYGVISYLVRERTQEIGVRMALGANRATVLRMVLLEGFRLAGAGLAIGLVASIPAARAMRSLLYGVRPSDPLTYLAVAFVLLGVALLASFIPAHRATRIDPMQALRCD
jgi:predicted permease